MGRSREIKDGLVFKSVDALLMDHIHRSANPKRWPTGYGTLIIDIPWPGGSTRKSTSSKTRGWQGRQDVPYLSLRPSQILDLPIRELMAVSSVILMWCPPSQVQLAMEALKEWGFSFVTMFPWIKVVEHPKRDVIARADHNLRVYTQRVGETEWPEATTDLVQQHLIYGPGPWVQHCTEYVIIARSGKPFGSLGNPRPARKGVIVAPRQEHSRKPDDLHQWVESKQQSDTPFPGPWLEMYARRRRAGWTVMGDQIK